ncbi:MAG: DUF397 domain-containing protein [Gammaproteobacteria bacterium]
MEVAPLPGSHRAVRDGKHPTGPALTVTAAEWTAFPTSLRGGGFSRPPLVAMEWRAQTGSRWPRGRRLQTASQTG